LRYAAADGAGERAVPGVGGEQVTPLPWQARQGNHRVRA
jgi:hypothetical protein